MKIMIITKKIKTRIVNLLINVLLDNVILKIYKREILSMHQNFSVGYDLYIFTCEHNPYS